MAGGGIKIAIDLLKIEQGGIGVTILKVAGWRDAGFKRPILEPHPCHPTFMYVS